MSHSSSVSHAADGAALGFNDQSLHALFAAIDQPHEDAADCFDRQDATAIFEHSNCESDLPNTKNKPANDITCGSANSQLYSMASKACH